NDPLWVVTKCRNLDAVGAHCVTRNQGPGSDEVFGGLRHSSAGSGTSYPQHCHCAQSKGGTTLHCVLLRLSAEQVAPRELRAAISERVLMRQARVGHPQQLCKGCMSTHGQRSLADFR